MPEKMTKEQFENKLKEFFQWTGSHERKESSWFVSLENWASQEFNRSYKKDFPKE